MTIINTEYTFPLKYQRMNMSECAAQFASFKALSGFNEKIDEVSTQAEVKFNSCSREKKY